MDLLIDIGNTRLKWCLLEADKITNISALICTQQLNVHLIAAWNNLPQPHHIIISSVASTLITDTVINVISCCWNNSTPIIASVRANFRGLTIAYSNPYQFGVDRWLALLATLKHGTGAAVVADCGTAVTIDVLNSANQHLGGLIIPGLKLLWNAIFNGTDITPVGVPVTFDMLGQNTGECIAAGAVQAIVGAIETTYIHLASPTNSPRLLITGGDAAIISKRLSVPHLIVPELVFEGLSVLLADFTGEYINVV